MGGATGLSFYFDNRTNSFGPRGKGPVGGRLYLWPFWFFVAFCNSIGENLGIFFLARGFFYRFGLFSSCVYLGGSMSLVAVKLLRVGFLSWSWGIVSWALLPFGQYGLEGL